MKTCKIENCEKPVHQKSWCAGHYFRHLRHGDPLGGGVSRRTSVPDLCSVDGCDRKHHAKDLCYGHYHRHLRHGEIGEAKFKAAHHKGDNHCGKYRCPGAGKMIKHLHYMENKQVYLDRANAQDPDQRRGYRNRWKKKNPSKVLAHGRFRKRGLKNRTPPWLTEEHYDQMNVFYHKAQKLTTDTGTPYEVDHIVPLSGRTVCGLHVPWNLRVITKSENNQRSRIWNG